MVDIKASYCPTISYRPIRLSDHELLEQIHTDIFPIRYETEFFQNVVNGRGIVSWGAVDHSRPNAECDKLIGFVTARIVLARDSEICDVLRSELTKSDQTLVYILTLGVVESYRNLGIATSLIREVIKYASSIHTCRAVYLHVISYNNAAIHLYKKMSFKCIRRLHDFYHINGKHYDAYLFVYYVNGGRSPCSLLELLRVTVTWLKSGFRCLTATLWKKEEKGPKRFKYKEAGSSVTKSQSKRLLASDSSGYDFV